MFYLYVDIEGIAAPRGDYSRVTGKCTVKWLQRVTLYDVSSTHANVKAKPISRHHLPVSGLQTAIWAERPSRWGSSHF